MNERPSWTRSTENVIGRFEIDDAAAQFAKLQADQARTDQESRNALKIAFDKKQAMEAAAKASEKVQTFITGKAVKKVIIVPKRMVNLIVG